ncbi:unnamed protein product [Clonostachys solani]|uniref:Uncharacterized protein n=1 Tax=Clonostachys solani TaxID=160281 RepID=A0A9P0EM12_9HYPO|nr:unnamed protein product [Clonostachys solani]
MQRRGRSTDEQRINPPKDAPIKESCDGLWWIKRVGRFKNAALFYHLHSEECELQNDPNGENSSNGHIAVSQPKRAALSDVKKNGKGQVEVEKIRRPDRSAVLKEGQDR